MVIEALTKRRDEIAADIRRLKYDLAHIDAVILIFQGQTPRRKTRRGEVARTMLDILRGASQPMTAREIAGKMGTEVNRVGVALSLQRRRGTVKAIGEPGSAYRWQLAA